MAVTACIFDLDGVIVDTAKYHFLAWQRLAQELGFAFTAEQNENLKGVSRMESLELLLAAGSVKGLSEMEKKMLAEKKNRWYVEYISDMDESEILPGVLSFLKEVRRSRVRTALGSASKNAGTILKSLDIIQYFDVVIDGNKVSKAKPDPEIFLLGASELGEQPADTVVFEDAAAGVEAALRAGMYCVGIGSPEHLSKAHLVIHGFEGVNWGELKNALIN